MVLVVLGYACDLKCDMWVFVLPVYSVRVVGGTIRVNWFILCQI